MDIRVLGTVEAVGTPPLPARLRRLLAMLLVHAGEVVSVDRLAAAVWGDDQPADPTNAVQILVSRLRRVLGPEPALLTRAPGYVLAAGATDADRFERLVGEARQGGGAPTAAERLDEALGLWRGPPFAEFADEDFARGEAARLAELRLDAEELRVDVALRSGRADDAVVRLEPLVDAHPFREGLRSRLILALYRAGRQADALARYADYREVLADELGIDPSPALQELYEQVLRQDPTLAGPPVAAPPRTATRPGVDLPAPQTSLVGRDDDLAAVAAALHLGRVLVLTGPGGVGKTRLALAAAAQAAPRYADGVRVVELATVGEPESVPEAVVSALGAQRRQELSVTERIVEYLRPLRMLLLLDNCEHVTTPVAQLVTAVAGRCAGVTVLATSREPLGVDGERVRPVRPLPVPTPGVTDPDAMAGAAAVRLFADRAAAASAGFTLDASNAAAVAELCRGLDGLPLALELAASRLRAMSPAEIVARLDARFGLLSGGRPAAPARHRTLRALVDWSYELLDDAERRAFIRVSVFAGPFTLDAAEAVCPEPDVAGVVAGLVDRSMLTADTRATPTRYTLLETLRAYARERLAATGTEDAVRRMHAEHVVAVAEAADLGLRGPDEAGWVGELVRTTPDLRAAHRWALDHDLGLAGRLSAALAWFAKFHMPPEVSAWAEQVAEAAIRDPDRPVVRLTAVLGVAAAGARTRGDFGRAEELAARATDTADDPDLRYLLMVRSGLALFHGRLDVADRLAERAARLATEVADPAWCAHAVANRSMAAAYRGDPDTARELAGQAAEIAATTGNPTATGWACYAHGEALADADPPRAIPFFERSRAVATSVQNRYLAGVALVSLAAAQGRLDNPVTALRLLTEVIDHWHAAGNRTQQWTTIRNLVEILVRLGADERAAVLDAGVTGSPTAAPAFGEVAARLDDVRAVLRDRLGPAAFRAAADRGAALDDDGVVALARTTAAEVAASAPSPHS